MEEEIKYKTLKPLTPGDGQFLTGEEYCIYQVDDEHYVKRPYPRENPPFYKGILYYFVDSKKNRLVVLCTEDDYISSTFKGTVIEDESEEGVRYAVGEHSGSWRKKVFQVLDGDIKLK